MKFSNFLLYHQVSYDQDADAMYLKITSKQVVNTDIQESGIIFDYDEKGGVVGIEILNASKNQDHVTSFLFSGISLNKSWESSSLSTSSKGTEKDHMISN